MSFGLVLSLLLTFSSVIAQDFAVPQNYRFNKKSDYGKYERYIPKAVDWLMAYSPVEKPGKRKEVNAFLLKWLEGAPNVDITLYKEVMDLTKTNPDLLMVFMGSWAKEILKSGKPVTEKRGVHVGLGALLDYYSKYKNNGIVKDKAVATVLKKKRKGQLHAWMDGFVKED